MSFMAKDSQKGQRATPLLTVGVTTPLIGHEWLFHGKTFHLTLSSTLFLPFLSAIPLLFATFVAD